jgi:large subunit ribosomal protein L30
MSKLARLRIRWVKSAVGYSQRQKATVRALGLRRLGHEVVKDDHPSIRGMIAKIRHLVEVSPCEAGEDVP